MLDFLLFVLASLGHACLLVAIVNFTYSRPYDRFFLRAFRASTGLFIWGGPIVFWAIYGFSVTAIIQAAFADGSNWLLAIHLVASMIVSCVVLPLVTIGRLRRRLPPGVHVAKSIFNVVAELGTPPLGNGKKLFMTKMPLNDIFNVDFTTITITRPDIPPAWDGLTLLQFSDLHFYGTPSREYFESVIRRSMADGIPDLLLITGDIVDGEEYLAWMEPILSPLRWNIGAFAILGNHDWWQDFDAVRANLRRMGMHVVSHAWEQIDIRGEKMTIIGHEGPWFQPSPAPDMSKCPTEGFRLLLSHTPDNINWAKRNNISLMLSGHNHGGQVRIPIFGSIFVPSKFSRRYDEGVFSEPPTLLHVNRGLSGKEPLRIRCRPQVTRLILKRG
ncbi:MAG: metallophosphoesterase [Planctomycetes bacterium]|nr:metallophosphoesterase [Planctomycetota bacterium]